MTSTITEKNSFLFPFSLSEKGKDSFTSLSSLLPYDLNTKIHKEISKSFEEYLFLLKGSLEAIYHYEKNDLEKFDALVGENACQIRALKLILITKTNSIRIKYLKEAITKLIERINFIINSDYINTITYKSKITFQEILIKENLFLKINHDECFLIQSFFLTETKITNIHSNSLNELNSIETTNPELLKKISQKIMSSFLKKFTKKSKEELAKNSVDFLINETKNSHLNELLNQYSENLIHNQKGLIQLPFYWNVKAFLYLIHKHNISIQLHAKFLNKTNDQYNVIDETNIFFQPTISSNGNIHFIKTNKQTLNPYINIQGIVHNELSPQNWSNSISQHTIYDLILSNAATHRQYLDPNITPSFNDELQMEFINHIEYAHKNGFSFKNFKSFYIRHVYAKSL